jgi:hypothetical protein
MGDPMIRPNALHSRHVGPNRLERLVQFLLAAPGDETSGPSATNRCAVAKPMPLLPPVTSATFPASFVHSLGYSVPCGTEYRYGHNEPSDVLYLSV